MGNQMRASAPTDEDNFAKQMARVGVPVFPYDGRCKLQGKLGGFTFKRGCGYTIVEGKMPLENAIKLYKSPVGDDIRAGASCTRPHPVTQATYFKNGQRVLFTHEKAEAERFLGSESMHDIAKRILTECLFQDDPSIGTEAFVELYHIDSELALYNFVQEVKTL